MNAHENLHWLQNREKLSIHEQNINYLYKNAHTSKTEVLYTILIKFRIPKKFVRLIKMCMQDTSSRVYMDKFYLTLLRFTMG
jgi:hypothetical protein